MAMRINSFLPLALVALLLLPACTSLSGRPAPQRHWSDDAVPAPERIPWAVGVFQSAGLTSTAVGSGTIIHSCDTHGTYVLTAHHCVSRGPEAGFWIYDWAGTLPEEGIVSRKDELRCYRMRLVYPEPPPEDGSESDKLVAELSATLGMLTADFAVLRVEAQGRFPAAAIDSSGEEQLTEGSPVELVAVQPEKYPHRHRFQWTDQWPEDVNQHGHSGGPILFQGKVFALIAGSWPDSNQVSIGGRPTVAEMRELLAEKGLAFLLTNGVCSKP